MYLSDVFVGIQTECKVKHSCESFQIQRYKEKQKLEIKKINMQNEFLNRRSILFTIVKLI